jgi:hypothetical protein
MIVIIFKRRDYLLFEYPLVWIEPIVDDSKSIVRLLSPENDIIVEFSNAQSKVL